MRETRNRLLAVAMAILLLPSIFTLFFLCTRTNPVGVEASDGYKVHNLNTGLNYTAIQGAINAPETLNGHTILVDAGVYLENVAVTKSVKLVGENNTTTIIDGNGSWDVVYVTADSVTVTNFTLRNSGTAEWNSGIRFNNCNNGKIIGNTVKKCDNGIRLIGCDNCLIQGNYIDEPLVLHQNIVAFDSNYCTIENNTAQNSWDGLRWDVSHHLTIRGNILKNNKNGISTANVDQSLIVENTFIKNSEYAAWFASGSTGNTLFHNNFINNTHQINMIEGSTNFVWNNGYPSGGNHWSDYTGVDVKSGLSQNESGKDGIGDTPKIIDANNRDTYPLMYQWNAFPVNNVDSGLGYYTIQGAIDAAETLNGHTIYVKPGTYYEHVQITKSLELFGTGKFNTIIDGSYTGDVLRILASNVNVTSITLRNSGTGYFPAGIYIAEGKHYNNIGYTRIINNSLGIYLYHSSNNSITGNIIADNRYNIYLFNSSNNVIVGNQMTNSTLHGVLFWDSSNNTITSNFIAYNYDYGLYLCHSSNFNNFTENTITNNDYIVWLLDSVGNVFYHNNFIDNDNSVVISPANLANIWDDGYPSGGNHWSDYTGVDANGDGIGDTPYVINADNRDNYPLMNKYVGYVFGDINYDGLVDVRDLYALGKAFMLTPASPKWNARADLNNDHIVDNTDLSMLQNCYGKTAPTY